MVSTYRSIQNLASHVLYARQDHLATEGLKVKPVVRVYPESLATLVYLDVPENQAELEMQDLKVILERRASQESRALPETTRLEALESRDHLDHQVLEDRRDHLDPTGCHPRILVHLDL